MAWGDYKYSPLAATCSKPTANVGETITLRVSGTGGTPTYTAYFSKSGGVGSLSQSVVSGLSEGVQATSTYVVQAGDAGTTITWNAYTTDTCPTGSQMSSTVTCSTTINVACTVPTCNFSVA